MPFVKTDSQYRKDLKQIHGNRIIPLEPYIKTLVKILHECRTCKTSWRVRPNDLLSGYGCPKCGVRRRADRTRKSDSDYKKDLKRVHGHSIIAREPYKGAIVPILHKCQVCSNQWRSAPTNILQGHGCNECHGTPLKTNREYRRDLSGVHGGRIIPKETYKGANTKIMHECQQCFHLWKVKPNDLLQGHGCRKCYTGRIYSGISLDFILTVSRKSRLRFQTYDSGGEYFVPIPGTPKGGYYVDGYNRYLNLVIEFHGDYWHGWNDKRSKAYKRTVRRDLDIAGVTNLIVVWEHEWKENPEETLSRVLATIDALRGRV